MKKTAVVFALIVFSMAIFLPFSIINQAANAQTSSYSIQKISHNVQVLYSGHVVITETIQLSGQIPSTFELGFPYKYGSYVLKGVAYDSNYKVLPVTLGMQLQTQSGFYGASVSLPSGTSSTFTVVFILSNGVLTPTSTGYALDFPAYLGFTQTVADFSVSFTLPSGAAIVSIDKIDGAINSDSYTKSNLAAFTYSPATATFSAASGYIQLVNIPSLKRQVNISPSGAVTGTDSYKIVNNATGNIGSFLINLPVKSSNVVARDEFGRVLSTSVQQNTSLVFVQNVTLAVAMKTGESSLLSLDYSLPSISSKSNQFVLSLDLFSYFNYYVNSASVTVSPPEGAKIVTPQYSQIGPSADVRRSAFQETVTINREGVSYVDSIIPSEDIASITFDYSPLWIAFRPTSWIWAIVVVGIVVVAVWTRPKGKEGKQARIAVAKVTAGMTLSPEHIKDFVEAYEEKSKLTKELRALDARAQHGRIPRRRYKVQRKTLELRLETLSQNIEQLKAILRSVGGSYADIVKQVESAEVELNEVQLSLQNIEVRHETGEMSMEVYRKQLTDLERRKEKAEATVNGLMLRLRGEIR